METPATGMWGSPGDYPADFVTIDDAIERFEQAPAELDDCDYMWIEARIAARSKVVDTLVELAHDLDARGLVLVPEVATWAMINPAESIVYGYACDYRQDLATDATAVTERAYAAIIDVGALTFPPLPPPIDTADADLVTGGE